MSYSGGPENLTNNHTDEFNYPIYGINAGTTSITFSGDDASSTGSQWRTSFVDLLMSGSSTNTPVSLDCQSLYRSMRFHFQRNFHASSIGVSAGRFSTFSYR